MPIDFAARPDTEARVQALEAAFNASQLQLSDSARVLFALALQAQDDDRVLPPGEIMRRLDQFTTLEDVVRNYVGDYGKRPVSFNRAFHVVHQLGFLAKYPWTPSPP